MANTIETNYQTELVALRGAESAPYFTVGSKAFIPEGELVGKRNGQKYGFVIRDAGEVENQLAIGANAKKNIVERKVELTIEPWHTYVENDVVEGKTDIQFDAEVAQPWGTKLIQSPSPGAPPQWPAPESSSTGCGTSLQSPPTSPTAMTAS